MTPEDLQQITDIFTTRLDRAVESIANDFSDLRGELTRRMEAIERRFELQAPVILSMDVRIAGIDTRIAGIDVRIAGLTRAIDQVIGAHDQSAGTAAAQQRAIDQLAARVKALEEKATGQQPPQQ
jgi:uncharacterized coiled-coil protein SlyX